MRGATWATTAAVVAVLLAGCLETDPGVTKSWSAPVGRAAQASDPQTAHEADPDLPGPVPTPAVPAVPQAPLPEPPTRTLLFEARGPVADPAAQHAAPVELTPGEAVVDAPSLLVGVVRNNLTGPQTIEFSIPDLDLVVGPIEAGESQTFEILLNTTGEYAYQVQGTQDDADPYPVLEVEGVLHVLDALPLPPPPPPPLHPALRIERTFIVQGPTVDPDGPSPPGAPAPAASGPQLHPRVTGAYAPIMLDGHVTNNLTIGDILFAVPSLNVTVGPVEPGESAPFQARIDDPGDYAVEVTVSLPDAVGPPVLFEGVVRAQAL